MLRTPVRLAAGVRLFISIVAQNKVKQMSLTSKLFSSALEALLKRPAGSGSLATVAKSIIRYPIKTVAAFIAAPFLAIRVAGAAKDPVRRAIAGVGLFIAVLLAWLAGTFLGTAVGALLVMSHIGMFWGIGFIVGTTLSVTLSVAFSVLVLNTTALFFLHMSSEEVVAYLKSISE